MNVLEALEARGVLRPIDRHLGELLARLAPADDPSVALAGALASRVLGDGDVCLDLEARCRRGLVDDDGQTIEGVGLPTLDAWLAALSGSPMVGDGTAPTPLVLRGTRVWLARYDAHEQRLADGLHRLATAPTPPVEPVALERHVTLLFDGMRSVAAQIEAVRRAAAQGLTVLAGGPGSGKTTTVVRVLAAILLDEAVGGRELSRILLVAPTGKAAARLSDSMRQQVAGLRLDGPHASRVREALPVEAFTVHRALGPLNDWLTRMRHGADNPLSADVVVVDEASMVDLPLMARLVDAVKTGARLVLIGDPDQLASVGAGAVLADLCRDALPGPVGGSVVHLGGSQRYEEKGEIGDMARALLAEDADRVVSLLRSGKDVRGQVPSGPLDREAALLERAVAAWTPFARAATPAERLHRFDAFRVLCAVRAGPSGVAALNLAVERAFAARRLLDTRGEWYPGRPVLVTANDYEVGLFNGDVGVADRDEDGEIRVFFKVVGGLRAVHPTRLPEHETTFATTIHKSQGSEFDEVAVALPPRAHPLLTRELLYTAVTRARERVVVHGGEPVVRAGVLVGASRLSGLRDALASRAGVASGQAAGHGAGPEAP